MYCKAYQKRKALKYNSYGGGDNAEDYRNFNGLRKKTDRNGPYAQLGWKLESDGRNIQQEAYELDIALDQDFCDCVYRSGKVMENASAQIMVKNISLEIHDKVFCTCKSMGRKRRKLLGRDIFCYRYPEYSGMEGFIYYCRE